LWVAAALLVLICGAAYYLFMPVAEVATVHRGTAISAVYGTVRIEPAFVVHVRAQNSGFIQLAEDFSAGRGAIGKNVTKGQLLATIADEATARQLKQARTDLQAATERAKLPLPSEELLKTAQDNLHRLEQVVASGNVPAVEFEKSKSEVNRLRGALENERIERDRNLQALEEAQKKLEAQMRNSEIRAPMDGLLTAVSTIDGELVSEGNQLFTVSSRKTYVRGERRRRRCGKSGNESEGPALRLSQRDFRGQGFVNSTGGRSGHAALHRDFGNGEAAGQPDGGNDRRDEHHYRHA
jgi:multidrug efflux pump subunit AcrA (membrane-fusion protein)